MTPSGIEPTTFLFVRSTVTTVLPRSPPIRDRYLAILRIQKQWRHGLVANTPRKFRSRPRSGYPHNHFHGFPQSICSTTSQHFKLCHDSLSSHPLQFIIQCVRKVSVHLWEVLEGMYTSVYTGLNLFLMYAVHFISYFGPVGNSSECISALGLLCYPSVHSAQVQQPCALYVKAEVSYWGCAYFFGFNK
jgi:hypothetical protein